MVLLPVLGSRQAATGRVQEVRDGKEIREGGEIEPDQRHPGQCLPANPSVMTQKVIDLIIFRIIFNAGGGG